MTQVNIGSRWPAGGSGGGPSSVKPADQGFAIELVASEARGQSLFFDESQRFPQGIEHGNRRGVVVGPGAFSPVVRDQGHIQIPTLAGAAPGLDSGQRTVAEGEGGNNPGGQLKHFCVAL